MAIFASSGEYKRETGFDTPVVDRPESDPARSHETGPSYLRIDGDLSVISPKYIPMQPDHNPLLTKHPNLFVNGICDPEALATAELAIQTRRQFENLLVNPQSRRRFREMLKRVFRIGPSLMGKEIEDLAKEGGRFLVLPYDFQMNSVKIYDLQDLINRGLKTVFQPSADLIAIGNLKRESVHFIGKGDHYHLIKEVPRPDSIKLESDESKSAF